MNNTTALGTACALNETQSGSNVAAHPVMNIIYVVVGALGTLGNMLVIIVMAFNKRLRNKTTNRFIMNQSLLDLTTSLLVIFVALFRDHMAAPEGLPREMFCRFWSSTYFIWSWLVNSTYNMVFLTIEKYIAILHPTVHDKVYTNVGTTVFLVVAWFIGPLWNSNAPITTRLDEHDYCELFAVWKLPESQLIVGVFTFILEWLIPICAFLCYGRIAMFIIKESKKTMVSTQQQRMRRARNNVIKTLITVSVCYFICWTPNQIYIFLFHCQVYFAEWANFTSHLYHVTVILVYCNCVVNPFIYSFQYHEFQEGFVRILKCRDQDRFSETDEVNPTTAITLNTMTNLDQ